MTVHNPPFTTGATWVIPNSGVAVGTGGPGITSAGGTGMYPFGQPVLPKEHVITRPKMDISIYRSLADVRAEVRSKDPKARWISVDYRIDGQPVQALGVDLELEYWKQSVAEGEVVVQKMYDTVEFSNAADAERFQEEFLPSIAERMKVQSFMKPFDDLYEFLGYSKVGNPVALQSILPVNFTDFFFDDEGDSLNDGGVEVWFMLRAGCVGRVFYFAQEMSFAFENEGDAILLAAYLTDAQKTYGDEAEANNEHYKPKSKKREQKFEETEAYLDYIKKMSEIIQEENPHRHWSRPMWGVEPGNLPSYDLTSITIGDAYNPDHGATSVTSPHRPWPSREHRYDMRKHVRRDPKALRASAAGLISAAVPVKFPGLLSELEDQTY